MHIFSISFFLCSQQFYLLFLRDFTIQLKNKPSLKVQLFAFKKNEENTEVSYCWEKKNYRTILCLKYYFLGPNKIVTRARFGPRTFNLTVLYKICIKLLFFYMTSQIVALNLYYNWNNSSDDKEVVI